jgi:gliding motility-associated-like protein
VNPTRNNASSAMAGNYSLKIKLNGCESPVTSPVVVAVNPIPAPPTISSNSPIEEDKTLNLTASNVTGASYAWSGPNGYNSNIQNPTIIASFANAGSYYATLTLNGCTSANSSPIIVVVNPKTSPVFQIPNAFTPNSDGHNDTFKIIQNGYVTSIISFRIFTKSGKLIFNDKDGAWDGRYAGIMLESDVYYWVVDVINKSNNKERYQGPVLLLK